jgi:hypothetical protein
MRPSLIRRCIRLILGALAALALPAQATFHLWTIAEAFSNADGTVQFIEFQALAGGQQFLQGHTLTATGGTGGPRTITFGSALPGDSAGRRFLVATPGFAAASSVAPDFTIPAGFLNPGGGTIDFAEGADTWAHPALPADGRSAAQRAGGTAAATPTNFAGQTGTLNLATAPDVNVQGLWWRAPAGSESGWGMAITQQGPAASSILFVAWYTYDANGNPLWLVITRGERVAANTWTGDIFQTRGPAFSAVPWDPAQVTATRVGTGTLRFTDANNGSFAYNVNGVGQTKEITRQVYGSPVGTCTLPAN